MKKISCYSFIILLLSSCTNSQAPNNPHQISEQESQFDLTTRDLFDFQTRMSIHDTLKIIVDLSNDKVFGWEVNTITKTEDQVFIQTTAFSNIIENEKQVLAKVPYRLLPTAYLSLENYIEWIYLTMKKTKSKNSTNFLLAIHGQDSISYGSDHPWLRLRKIKEYLEIKKLIYPEAAIYFPVIPPPPPEQE